ncbi:D-sedoheptulose-7-phosphate isomerase [Flagellimonas sp.]|uniref:D-sedoheptulose-7-phosphate isomerase n=1 Tax=Flagellimonas sp. TaxID=2058762 RepID=UPI003B5C702D
MKSINDIIVKSAKEHQEVLEVFLKDNISKIEQLCELIVNNISIGGKILLIGNGGSAADAEHIAAEFVGRFKKKRKGFTAYALTSSGALLTALGNDFNFDNIFKRQINALARNNDLLLAFTSSGKSTNIIKGLESGKQIGCITIGFCGQNSSSVEEFCDVLIKIPSSNTQRIQETYMFICHVIIDLVESVFLSSDNED